MNQAFELLLFSVHPETIRRAAAAGVDGFIVDWEWIGKPERQAGADTQINTDTLDDLVRVRRATNAKVICRINPYDPSRRCEIDDAVDAGADEILLPMVRTQDEVEAVLDRAAGRCGVGILVETLDAVRRAEELAALPLSRVYVGLNDLSIERHTPCIFSAVLDGTLDRIRSAFRIPFGFGGLTVPEGGNPIPCRLFMAEMARLDCRFSFLRRSFHRDMADRNMDEEIPRIRAVLQSQKTRSDAEVQQDRRALASAIQRIEDAVSSGMGGRTC